MVLIESIYSCVYVLYSIRFLVIEMLLWEYVQGGWTEFAVESRQVLSRFAVFLHQDGKFFDTLFHLDELLEVSVNLRIIETIQF